MSSVGESGNTPATLIRPIVTLRPVRPHQADGIRTDPPVSVPIAHGTMRAAVAAPEPLLDPPAAR